MFYQIFLLPQVKCSVIISNKHGIYELSFHSALFHMKTRVFLKYFVGVCSSYLELLDKLQKWIYRTVGPSLAASLEPLAHLQNVASLSLFCKGYFVRCSFKLAELVPLPYSGGRSTGYSDRLHDFSVTNRRCLKLVSTIFYKIFIFHQMIALKKL